MRGSINSKAARRTVEQHVLDQFAPDMYGNEAPAIDNLRDQMKSFEYMNSSYKGGHYMAEGGTFLIYTTDQRKFLQELRGQTEEQAAKYKPEQVFNAYCHVIGLAVERLVK